MKKLLMILLAVLLTMALWGCGSEPAQEETSATLPGGDAMTASALYCVTVTDEAGTPIPGAMVQLCSDVCMVSATNEYGQAWFHVDPADYKVSLTVVPQGYAHVGEVTEFTFPEGSLELTIVLKAQ